MGVSRRPSPYEHVVESIEHTLDIVPNVVRTKPQHSVTFRFEPRVTNGITPCVLRLAMLFAVDFDNEFPIVTNEIEHIASERCLAAKMETLRPKQPKLMPKSSLEVRRAVSQLA